MHEKLKSWLADDTIFIAVLLVLIAGASYGLGRISVGEGTGTTAKMSEKVHLSASSTVLIPKILASSTLVDSINGAAVITAAKIQPLNTGPYVGSKSGTKYYLSACSGAKRIKDANKVFFATVHDAQASGYQPASNCPGL